MKAWLLTWEGTSGPALAPERKIVAIISARRSSSTIEEIADLLYCRSVDSAYDAAFLANKRSLREYQYRHLYSNSARIFYGRNPCIYARLVSNFMVERDEARKVERVRWTEPPYIRIERQGALPVEIEPESEQELVRALEPLSLDIYGREGQLCGQTGSAR